MAQVLKTTATVNAHTRLMSGISTLAIAAMRTQQHYGPMSALAMAAIRAVTTPARQTIPPNKHHTHQQ